MTKINGRMINVIIGGKTEIKIKEGTTLEELSKDYSDGFSSKIVAAIVNNETKGLTFEIEKPCKIEFIDLTTEDGMRIYRRSLAFIMNMAASELYPGSKTTVCHSLNKGLYCEFKYKKPLDNKMLENIELRMREIVKKKLPFVRNVIPIDEAQKICEKESRIDMIHLVEHRKKPHITLYECNGLVDCYYGHLVPNTGYLDLFELKYYPPGFILCFPDKSDPAALPPFAENRKLFNIFNEFKRWGSILQVENVGMLNDIIRAGQIGDFIRIAEGLHEKKIAQIADVIAANPEIRLVLIAGPSSSGKTTFAQRLGIQLRVNCLKPIMISLDNYFLDRNMTPKDENGEYDLESIEAVDIKLFNQHLQALIDGEEVEVPIFNFHTGSREKVGTKLKIDKNQLIIIEGIHGLNERLTSSISRDKKFKIYVSALTSLSIDDHNRIPTTDTRIIRRIVRDNQFRGHSALATIKMWPSVRRGEENNIFPFQEEADIMFNSAMIYELSVLKTYAEPLLASIGNSHKEYAEAKRLLNFLGYFLPVDTKEIPINSIVREFIGGGCFVR